jgi:hypothetical protein
MRASSSLVVLAVTLLAAASAGACAQLAGLPGYAPGDDLSDPDGDIASGPDGSTASGEAGTGDDGSTGDTSEPSGEDTGEDTGQNQPDGGHTGGTHPVLDAAIDAGSGPEDAGMPDAYVCGPDTCNGCCTAAGCAGGQSVGTCGVGGSACRDCSSAGACSSEGTCVTPVKDAGPPPMCMAANCKQCAVAPIQGPCCKLDNTCGCQFTVFDPCM